MALYMSSFAGLPTRDVEPLLDTIESSLRIQTRSQFYLWTQGTLQRFIAHETLWCGHGDVGRQAMHYECYSRFVDDPGEGRAAAERMLARMTEDWSRSGRVPRRFGSPREGPGVVERRQLVVELARQGWGHVLAHGPREIQGAQGSFFAFVAMPQAPGARETYLVELLMPYLHVALHRVLANDNAATRQHMLQAPLTERELQVLRWVKNGKTNEEISVILGISATTVKNHVQKILRKLDVSNRAQAVGKADALGLFTSTNQRAG